MREMWLTANEVLRLYMGTGLIVIFFLAALFYLLLAEKRKPIRILFVYVPVILLLLFYNPAVIYLVHKYADREIYYRILWLLPVAMVVAYAVVKIYGILQGRKKYIWAVAAAFVLMVSGSLIYQNPYFHKAQNVYHVPQSVVEICDAIEVEGREVMAVFPGELIPYVRQYSAMVCMPYGREIEVDRWNYSVELYDVMEAEIIDAKRLAELARDHACAYIVLPDAKEIDGDLSQYSFEQFGTVSGYVIYKDATVDLSY